MNQKKLSNQESEKAKHLAFLLAQSVMSEEQKEAWINLLPMMVPEQVDVLIGILEREHQTYQAVSKDLLLDLKKLEESLRKEIYKLKDDEKKLIEAFIKKEIEKNTHDGSHAKQSS